MTDKRNTSGIFDHKQKKGALVRPFNASIGDRLQFNSWAKDRIPEYLWLGLILHRYGREAGLNKAMKVLSEIAEQNISLVEPKLSSIFSLDEDKQRIVYEIIAKQTEKMVLAPLTVFYANQTYLLFNQYFYISNFSIENRIDVLSEAIKTFIPHQSHEATDLRFLVICSMLYQKKLGFSEQTQSIITELNLYPTLEHTDERMRSIRPTIRSMEGMKFEEQNFSFSKSFWKEMNMLTPCNPIKIEFPSNPADYQDFIEQARKVLEYLLAANLINQDGDRFDVISGMTNYALKIFNELCERNLGNTILGRHGIRTIIEVYIMLKYLINNEGTKPNIWTDYKIYGIGKYKLILLKDREINSGNDESKSHFVSPVVEYIVNEIRWEEFTDIDLTYFDKKGIRDKSIEVGEKELYDIFYDYDSSFAHGLWGAVRESSMLHCDNATHSYHSIPDVFNDQNLPDVKADAYKVLLSLYSILAKHYDVPEWFKKQYLTAQ